MRQMPLYNVSPVWKTGAVPKAAFTLEQGREVYANSMTRNIARPKETLQAKERAWRGRVPGAHASGNIEGVHGRGSEFH